MEQESSGQLVTSGQRDVLSLALDKLEHPGRIRGVGQDVTITQYWKRKSAPKENVDGSSVRELKAKMKDMENNFGEKIKTLELVIQNLMLEKQQQVSQGHPLQQDQVSPTSQPNPQSGKASCSALKTTPIKSDEEVSI